VNARCERVTGKTGVYLCHPPIGVKPEIGEFDLDLNAVVNNPYLPVFTDKILLLPTTSLKYSFFSVRTFP